MKKKGNKISQIDDKEFTSFLTYLVSVKGYSEKTQLNYGEDVASFLLFLKEHHVSKATVDRKTIDTYLYTLHVSGVNKASTKRHLSALRHFYKYLDKYQGYRVNPFQTVSSPKPEKRLPHFLTFEEVNQFLDGNEKRTDRLKDRDQAILELLFASGLRASELISLKFTDVNEETRLLRIKGKGKKERMVPFSLTAKKALDKYLEDLRPLLLKPEKEYTDVIFLNSRGEPLTERGLEYLVSQAALKSNFTLKIHPHMLRHSFATELLNNDMDLRTIQELLGHSSIKTTSIYTHVSYQDLKKTYERCFPKATEVREDFMLQEERACIFDFNGTMFFDEDKHVLSWRKFAKDKFGVEIKDEDFMAHIHGHNNKEILSFLAKRDFTDKEVLQLATEKEKYYQKICEEDQENLHLVNGLCDFLDLLVQSGIKLAIATASMKPNVDWYIKTFHLDKWFPLDRIIYDDGTLVRGKPDPLIYERALTKLDVKPEEAIVFEDSLSGIQSAYQARVKYVVAIENEERRKKYQEMKEVHEVIPDFTLIPQDILDFLGIRKNRD